MPGRLDKYFWGSPRATFSKEFQLVQLLEYASFPDLFAIPFEELQQSLPHLDLESHRIPQSRRLLFKKLIPFIARSSSLEQAVELFVAAAFAERGYRMINWEIFPEGKA